jgi:type IV pilus assembly protein PilY1
LRNHHEEATFLAGVAARCWLLCLLAAPTQIAQVPLLNITGTGTVKPNLMLLFDNSGSMDQTYTPDYVNDNLCRSNVSLQAGIMACNVGHPPFMSPGLQQAVLQPGHPLPGADQVGRHLLSRADRRQHQQLDRGQQRRLRRPPGRPVRQHRQRQHQPGERLPDLKWCTTSSSGVCQFNTSTYSYPDATYKSAVDITTGPYYYTIGVGQYCTDDTMKNCKSTSIGRRRRPAIRCRSRCAGAATSC